MVSFFFFYIYVRGARQLVTRIRLGHLIRESHSSWLRYAIRSSVAVAVAVTSQQLPDYKSQVYQLPAKKLCFCSRASCFMLASTYRHSLSPVRPVGALIGLLVVQLLCLCCCCRGDYVKKKSVNKRKLRYHVKTVIPSQVWTCPSLFLGEYYLLTRLD